MNYLKASIPILIGVMSGIGAAYAQQPPNNPSAATYPPATTAPAAAPGTTATPATAAALTPATPSAAVLRQAKLAGYHIRKQRQGTTVFCKEETHLGSRFSTESCIDETQLEEILIRVQTQRDNLANRRGTGTDIR